MNFGIHTTWRKVDHRKEVALCRYAPALPAEYNKKRRKWSIETGFFFQGHPQVRNVVPVAHFGAYFTNMLSKM